jgi:hypothetical protein
MTKPDQERHTDRPEDAWDDITDRLSELTDKQLSNLILVIRETQVDRETETILSKGRPT